MRTKHGKAHSGQDIWGQVPPSLGCGHPTSQGSGRQQNLPSPLCSGCVQTVAPCVVPGRVRSRCSYLLGGRKEPHQCMNPQASKTAPDKGKLGMWRSIANGARKGDLLRPRGLLGIRPLVPPAARWGVLSARQEGVRDDTCGITVPATPELLLQEERSLRARPRGSQRATSHQENRPRGGPRLGSKRKSFLTIA